MYYTTIVFAEYGIAIVMTILSMATIGMIVFKSRDRYTEKCKAIMLFIATTLAMCLFNFSLYYFDAVLRIYEVDTAFRIIDYLINAQQIAVWFFVLRTVSDGKKTAWFYTGVITACLYGIASMLTACIFMDEYYHIADDMGMSILFAGRLLLAVCFIAMIIYSARMTKEVHTTLQRRYVYITTAVIIIGAVSYIIAMKPLIAGRYESGWQEGYFDTTGLYALIISLLSYVFVFKEDFSPLFSEKSNPETEKADMIQQTAILHHLTTRECEVLELLYKGLHNPEIAAELCISPNTAKKHVQNIFEKTGVNSRMELIYLVNLKNPAKNGEKSL